LNGHVEERDGDEEKEPPKTDGRDKLDPVAPFKMPAQHTHGGIAAHSQSQINDPEGDDDDGLFEPVLAVSRRGTDDQTLRADAGGDTEKRRQR